jgi:hypothetical protein
LIYGCLQDQADGTVAAGKCSDVWRSAACSGHSFQFFVAPPARKGAGYIYLKVSYLKVSGPFFRYELGLFI